MRERNMFARYLLLLSLFAFSYARDFKGGKVLMGIREQLDDMEEAIKKMTTGMKNNGDGDVDDGEYNDGSEGDASEDIYKINEKAQSQEKGVTNFQTDMILTPEQLATLKYNKNRQGDAIKNPRNFWPSEVTRDGSKKIIIPYTIQGFVGKTIVEQAAAHIKEKVPCINFVDKTGTIGRTHHIRFINDGGCYSYVGKVNLGKGYQEISLQNRGCLYKGIAVHEMMHALGYFHEQSRPDRDIYIRIVNANIALKFQRQFEKMNSDSQNTKYDYGSIMHYGQFAFSTNGKATIVRVDGKPGSTLGQRKGLSEIDARQLRMKYCGEAETTKPAARTTAPTPPRPPTPPAPPAPTTPAATTVPPHVENKLWCDAAVAGGLCRFCPVAEKYCSLQCVDKVSAASCAFWALDKSGTGGSAGYCAESAYMHQKCAGSCKYKCVKV